ncbi:MAG: hypothetical protein ACYCYP_09190 [Leptospirales bacterium]
MKIGTAQAVVCDAAAIILNLARGAGRFSIFTTHLESVNDPLKDQGLLFFATNAFSEEVVPTRCDRSPGRPLRYHLHFFHIGRPFWRATWSRHAKRDDGGSAWRGPTNRSDGPKSQDRTYL